MEQPPTIKDPNALLRGLLAFSQQEPMMQTPGKKRIKKRTTSKNEKAFLDALIDFRRHGYLATWSMNGSWVVLELYGVERSFNGFKAAAKALMDRTEQWNNQNE